MRKNHLYTTLIFSLLFLTVSAAPRLTVVAVVDGLTTENLTMLRPYWQQGGFRTLSEEAFQTSVSYPHMVYGGNETTATLLTGTTPNRHGYTMDQYFLRKDRLQHAMLEDESVRGIGTTLQLSPKSLLSQTVTDHMRLLYPNAKIYAVGIQAETTILLAGHAANACCWLDSREQKWISTAAYDGGLPSAAYAQNTAGRLAELAGQTWTPKMDMPAYLCPTQQERRRGFSYSVSSVFLHAPQANTAVIELALDIQQKEHMGEDATPDMLMLQLNTLSPNATTDYITCAEQEDMYLRLNQDLGFLMEQLDRRIGHDNYQILVVGRPILGMGTEQLTTINMPAQSFNVDRASALISSYLMALYGHERWVDGGFGQCIYLNRTLIEQKRMDLEALQRQVANLLMEFEGIQIAMPGYEAIQYPMLNSTLCKRHTGDVVFMLEPGWILMNNDRSRADYVIDENPQSPLLLWSGTVRPMPQNPLDATGVAELLF